MAVSTKTDSLLKGAGAAATAFFFARSANARGQWPWALAIGAGAITYSLVEQHRVTQDATNYAASAADRANAPAPTSGLSSARRMRWRV